MILHTFDKEKEPKEMSKNRFDAVSSASKEPPKKPFIIIQLIILY